MTKNLRPALLATAVLIGFGAPSFAADSASGGAAVRAQVATPAVSGSATATPHVTGTTSRRAAAPATPAHPAGRVAAPRSANVQTPARASAGAASTAPIPGAPRVN